MRRQPASSRIISTKTPSTRQKCTTNRKIGAIGALMSSENYAPEQQVLACARRVSSTTKNLKLLYHGLFILTPIALHFGQYYAHILSSQHACEPSLLLTFKAVLGNYRTNFISTNQGYYCPNPTEVRVTWF